MDLTESIAPKSDQLDAVDLLAGPRTFTITGVARGNAEQPFQFTLAEFPRVWRPSKGMRRVLVAAWGPDGKTYTGRCLTLYCDPDVKFGGERVGGVRISHMTDLPGGKKLDVPLLITRGKGGMFTVQPLTEPAAPVEPTAEQVAASNDVVKLRAMWQSASPQRRKQIEARVAELTAADAPADDPNAHWGNQTEGGE